MTDSNLSAIRGSATRELTRRLDSHDVVALWFRCISVAERGSNMAILDLAATER